LLFHSRSLQLYLLDLGLMLDFERRPAANDLISDHWGRGDAEGYRAGKMVFCGELRVLSESHSACGGTFPN
jgi:hypothetical protein